MPLKTLYNLTVCTAIVLSLVLIGAIWHLGSNSMIACGFFGAFLIHAGARPKMRHLLLAALAGAGFAASYAIFVGHFGPSFFVAAIGAGAFLGEGSLAVMSCHRIWTGSETYKSPLRDALVLPVFSLIAGIAMNTANGRPQASYDYFLHAFDATLGTPGHAVALWFRAFPPLKDVSGIVYSSLLIFPPLYHAWTRYRGLRGGVDLMKAFVVSGVFGFVLYQVCPAIGPYYSFKGRFPNLPPPESLTMQPFLSAEVHNAMPSMHMTWALLVWWSAWRLGRLATIIATVFVGFTVLAMLGFGEHYLIDLIVAIPLVMLVEGVCLARRKLAIAGAAMVVGWVIFLRLGLALRLPAPATWALVLATITITLIMQIEARRRPELKYETSRLSIPASGSRLPTSVS